MSDAEDEEMEQQEAASSGSEAGSSDADSDDEEQASSSSEEDIEPRVLPNRSTRGSKMGAMVEEEDEADQEFWQQDFFQVLCIR